MQGRGLTPVQTRILMRALKGIKVGMHAGAELWQPGPSCNAAGCTDPAGALRRAWCWCEPSPLYP